MPNDMGDAAWSETDASNNNAAPAGWPDGQAPSTVKGSARGMMGALKRFWVRTNSTLTTAGTTTAYTLSYGAAEATYYNGEEYSFVINATCGASPTLNVNGGGARAIRKFQAGAYVAGAAGDLVANQPIRVRYNSSSLSFDIVGIPAAVGGWQTLGSRTLLAASSYDLTGIASTYNHIEVIYDLTFGTNNNNLYLQFYGAGGVIDGGANYSVWMTAVNSSAVVVGQAFLSASAIILATSVSNSANVGASGQCNIQNIQGAKFKQANFQSQWLDQAGVVAGGASGHGTRNVAERITGVRLQALTGTISGRVTVMGTPS